VPLLKKHEADHVHGALVQGEGGGGRQEGEFILFFNPF
jgi:hypothetical protein